MIMRQGSALSLHLQRTTAEAKERGRTARGATATEGVVAAAAEADQGHHDDREYPHDDREHPHEINLFLFQQDSRC